MAKYKTVVTPVLMHWSYYSFFAKPSVCPMRYAHGFVVNLFFVWKMVDFLIGHYTYRIFPPAIDIIPTLLAVVYSNGKYTN